MAKRNKPNQNTINTINKKENHPKLLSLFIMKKNLSKIKQVSGFFDHVLFWVVTYCLTIASRIYVHYMVIHFSIKVLSCFILQKTTCQQGWTVFVYCLQIIWGFSSFTELPGHLFLMKDTRNIYKERHTFFVQGSCGKCPPHHNDHCYITVK